MTDEFLDRLNKVYAEHPLSAASILERVYRRKGTLEGLTETDLCFDPETHVTDQNHSGGVAAVVEIAETVALGKDMRVIDVGTGLGGAPRVLSQRYGCRSVGIELTEGRFRDAVELTRLVGLDHLVTLLLGDFLTLELEAESFDLVLGQGSFNHFCDQHRLLARSTEVLRSGGHLVMEDAILLRPVVGVEEGSDLRALGDCWNGWFGTLEDWMQGMRRAGLEVVSRRDLSEPSHRSLLEALRLVEQGKTTCVSTTERNGWRLGASLAGAGLIGYVRLIARRT
jgi:cyclopropane fatty-acyl-phospholipid synthase-like methyltransferase